MPMKRVQGNGLDGSNVATTLGKTEIPLVEANYGDSIETETLTEMGAQEIDERSLGTYKTEDVSIKMSSTRFRSQFLPALAANGFGNKPFPMVISFSHPDLGDDSDLLEQCRIVNLAAATAAAASVLTVEVKLVCNQIRWGSARATINRKRGVDQGENTL